MLSVYILLLSSVVPYGFACMRVSAPDGVIPIEMVPTTVTALMTIPAETSPETSPATTTALPLTTTTIPPKTCPASGTLASVFVASDTNFVDFGYGMIAPSSSCSTCDGGTVYYYDSADNPMPVQGSQSLGTLTGSVCPNMCMCDISGDCWTLTDPSVVVIFWQYCTGGTCGVYTFLITEDNASGITTGSKTITGIAQVTPDYDYYPVTNSDVYVNAASIGCNSCPTYTCKTTSA